LLLRPFAGSDDYQACLELQRAVWSFDDPYEYVPPVVMKVGAQIGSVGAGAFDEAGRMVGFVWGLTGLRRGRLAHWSHMLGVLPEVRDQGLGRRLKLYQRERLLEMGIATVHWTFDPLEAKNAHLNFNRLGAIAEEYARDFYGSGQASPLHRGQGTDRLIITWHLSGERMERALAGELPDRLPGRLPGDLGADAGLPIANDLPEPRLPARVEVPAAIQTLKREHPEEAPAWRAATRRAFEALLAQGGTVRDFYRDPETGRCFYVIS